MSFLGPSDVSYTPLVGAAHFRPSRRLRFATDTTTSSTSSTGATGTPTTTSDASGTSGTSNTSNTSNTTSNTSNTTTPPPAPTPPPSAPAPAPAPLPSAAPLVTAAPLVEAPKAEWTHRVCLPAPMASTCVSIAWAVGGAALAGVALALFIAMIFRARR